MQASLQMTVFFDLCIGRSPFSEREPQRGGFELKHVRSAGEKTQCAKRRRQSCKRACK